MFERVGESQAGGGGYLTAMDTPQTAVLGRDGKDSDASQLQPCGGGYS